MIGQRFGHNHRLQDFCTSNRYNTHFHNICREPEASWSRSCHRRTRPGAAGRDLSGNTRSLCRNQSERRCSWDTGSGGPAWPCRSSHGSWSDEEVDLLIYAHHAELSRTWLRCCWELAMRSYHSLWGSVPGETKLSVLPVGASSWCRAQARCSQCRARLCIQCRL